MFRRICYVGAAMALSLAGIANAAEPVAMDPARWDGAYAGLAFGGSSRDVMTNSIGSADVGFEHPSIGLVAGYRFQADRLLLGFEADIATGGQTDAGGCDGTSSCAFNDALARTVADGHLRGTAGLALTDEVALFVAGGLAVAYQGGGVFSLAEGPNIRDYDDDYDASLMYGYTVGGGIEYRPLPGWTLRTEVLYDVYDSTEPATASSSAQVPGCCAASASITNVPSTFNHVITGRVALLHRY
jgi:opacity protein-like surface antigen